MFNSDAEKIKHLRVLGLWLTLDEDFRSTINNGVTNVNDNADSKKALIEWFRRF
jgi:hypothetical protein